MCGRFGFSIPPRRAWEYFQLADMHGFETRRNIPPGTDIPVIVLDDDDPSRRVLRFFHWGLVPSWADDPKIGYKLINARGETAPDKPAFRNAFARRRCLIPADRFYEWEKRPDGTKQPYAITMADHSPFSMAGLWEHWTKPDGEELFSATILTTEANELVAHVHDRMPVILAPEDYGRWLAPDANPESLRELIRPYPAEGMALVQVSTRVNDPKNQDIGPEQCLLT